MPLQFVHLFCCCHARLLCRGLWLDLLTEMFHAHSIIGESVAAQPDRVPEFAALNLVRSRAVFKSSGHYSKDLLVCTRFAAGDSLSQRVVAAFLKKPPGPRVNFWAPATAPEPRRPPPQETPSGAAAPQPATSPAPAVPTAAATPREVAVGAHLGVGRPAPSAVARAGTLRPHAAPVAPAAQHSPLHASLGLSGEEFRKLRREALSLAAVGMAVAAARLESPGGPEAGTCPETQIQIRGLSAPVALLFSGVMYLLRLWQ